MENLLNKLQTDLDSARGNHSQQIALIEEWRLLTEAKPSTMRSQKDGNYSSVMNQLVKKTIESATPSLVEPFLGSNIVNAQGRDAESDSKAEIASATLNYFWNYSIPPEKFIEPLVRNLQIDGTVFIKVGWKDNHPTSKEIAPEALVIDPSAKTLDEAKFVIEQSKVSVSDILSNPEWYGKHTLDSLHELQATSTTIYDTEASGNESSFNFEDRLRQLISVNTYYGEMTVDGELKQIVAMWSDSFLINVMDSPYPTSWNGIPFCSTDYIPVSGSLYGESIPSLLSYDQQYSTALDRSIMKQLDHSTLGQRGFAQGALDPVNERRFKAGKDFKFNAKGFEMWEGGFNQLSPDIFMLHDKTRQSAEELSGISRLNAGLDPRALNSNVSATASSLVNSNAQRRLLLVMRHISSLLEAMFRKWLDISVVMAEDLSVRVGGQLLNISGFDLDGNYDLVLNVQTDGQKQEKAQKLSMILQQLGSNPSIPQSVVMKLTAEYTRALEMHELADELMGLSQQIQQSEGQPNPMAQQAQMMEMEAQQAQIAKDTARAQLDEAKAMNTHIDNELLSYGVK